MIVGNCTSAAPWSAEGTAGKACFPDQTCDPGLSCAHGQCIAGDGSFPGGDQGLCASPLAAPRLSPYPATTANQNVLIIGLALKAQEVEVSGGQTTQIAKVSNGYFCVSVTLRPRSTNTLQLVAKDSQGCISPSTKAVVAQTAPGKINLFYQKKVTSNVIPQNGGALSQLTDGNTDDPVTLVVKPPTGNPGNLGVCDNAAYLWVDLGATKTITEIVVDYPVISDGNFTSFVAIWNLLVSTIASPPQPLAPNTKNWKSVREGQNDTGAAPLTIALSNVQARHVALLLCQDGASTSTTQTFSITEIEAWGLQQSSPEEVCPL